MAVFPLYQAKVIASSPTGWQVAAISAAVRRQPTLWPTGFHRVGDTEFEAERGCLTRLAYRMMGWLAEAEDVVQDAWLRWVGVDLDSPPAHLTRIVTRLCPDRRRSTRARRKPTSDPGCQILSWVPWSRTRRSPTTSRSR